MKIALFSRYPRVDVAGWKRDLAAGLRATGAELTILYTRSALSDQLEAGVREFGVVGTARRYADARLKSRAIRPVRRREGTPSAEDRGTLASWAAEQRVPVRRFRRMSDPGLVRCLRDIGPDLAILAGADIVPAAVLEVPRAGTLNPHYGLLPRYRGMNVAEWSIYHDDPVGVSIHLVDPGIDTGEILCRSTIAVETGETLERIRAKQQRLSSELLLEAATTSGGWPERRSQTPEEGRQYYRMHPQLRRAVELRLESGSYSWISRPARRLGPEDPI